jgi:excisionase family DNA binding protein
VNPLLTITEVAALLRVKPKTVYRWIRSNKLRAFKLLAKWKIAMVDLEYFLKNNANMAFQAKV